MKMKILILVLIAGASVVFAADVIDSFTATSDGKTITVSWRSSDESQTQAYDIERSSSNQPFKVVNTIQAKGYSYNYTYIDDSAFLRDNGKSDRSHVVL